MSFPSRIPAIPFTPRSGKSFVWLKYDIQAEKNRRKNDVNGFFFVLLCAIKEMQDLWNLDS